MEPQSDTWLAFDEHAASIGVHVKTMIRWASKGLRGLRLKHRRRGVLYQTTRAFLDEFFEAGTGTGKPAASSVPATPVPASSRRQQAAAKAARQILGAG